MKVSVIVPAYNEERTILEILKRVSQQRIPGVELEVLVIDDGSKDRTIDLLRAHPTLYTRLIQMDKNGGKGAAVQRGLKEATGEYVIFQDADLEYDPSDYPALLKPIIEYGADIVMGSRLTAPQMTRVVYFWHKVGNRFITLFFNLINNLTFTDIYSCYLVYRRSLVRADELKTMGWDQQAEILSLAVKRGRVFYEVPIAYHGRTYDEGKKIRAYHVVAVLWAILKYGLSPRKLV